MSVTLRKKPLASGKQSLYLDYYSDGERKYEFLKLYLLKRPTNDLDKQHNKETLKLAESIRSKRELQINTAVHGFEPEFKRNINFIEYFQTFADNYPKRDKRLVTSSFTQFKAFIGKASLKPHEVTEQLCIDFREYLESRYNGETPHNYFAKFKKVLRQAVREKVMPIHPALDVINYKTEGVKKDIISIAEIQALATATCGNSEVKRAFLFACCTGVRYCDVKELKWKNINTGVLTFVQAKTGHPVTTNLNSTAIKLLGRPGKSEQPIFTLPSHTAISKCLKHWAKRAGLQKHITFHCARHSFATNLLIFEADVKTVSSLLGHTTLEQTQKYVRVVEALKQQAVNKLPEINF